MPAPFVMPGYYWDEKRQKFFKVEQTGTAPAGARWSLASVSSRRREEERQGSGSGSSSKEQRGGGGRGGNESNESDDTRQRKDNDGHLAAVSRPAPEPIVRTPHGSGLAMMLLGRQMGQQMGDAATTTAAAASSATSAALAAFTGDLHYRGQLPRTRVRVSCMWVRDAASETDNLWPADLGVVYTNGYAGDRADIQAHYLARDARGCIPPTWPVEGPLARYHGRYDRVRPEGLDVPDASALAYHAPSHRMIATSRRLSMPRTVGGDRRSGASMYVFRPRRRRAAHAHIDPDDDDTLRTGSGVVALHGRGALDAVYGCAVAPAGAPSSVMCAVAAGRGLVVLNGDRLGSYGFLSSFWKGSPPAADGSVDLSGVASAMFLTAVDFYDGHPQLVLAGGRRPHPWIVDLREAEPHQPGGWHAIGTPSDCATADSRTNAITHVRSVGGHRVVSAALRDTMLLYDVRCMGGSSSSSSSSSSPSSPSLSSPSPSPSASSSASSVVFAFSGYRNTAALMNIGFDVDRSLGLVATSSDDGRGFSLFSLDTGQRLPLAPATTARIQTPNTGASALRFAHLPGDRVPSLVAATGPKVAVYSMGDPAAPQEDDLLMP